MWELGTNIANTPSHAAADCVLAKSLGAKWVRVSYEEDWGNVETSLRQFRKACDDNGLKMFQTCQPRGHLACTTQKRLDEYAAYCALAASIADITSTGNEDNGYGSNDPSPNPQAISDMLLAALEARNKLAPKKVIATPGLCPGNGQFVNGKWQRYAEPLLFFKAIITHNPQIITYSKLMIDHHGYCDWSYPATTPADWNQAFRTREFDKYLGSLGHPGFKFSWSEFGAATGPPNDPKHCTPVGQGQRLRDYKNERDLARASGVKDGPSIWYTLRDGQGGNVSWANYCGLVDSSGKQKPVAAVFKELAGS